jgi:ribosome-associated protein
MLSSKGQANEASSLKAAEALGLDMAKLKTDMAGDAVKNELEDMKAVNVKVLDVRKLTDVTDTLIVATGNSDRHVKSIADRLIERCREAGHRAYGVEGQREGEWVLVDLQDLIVHVMLPRIREFYGLEKLWDLRPARREPQIA